MCGLWQIWLIKCQFVQIVNRIIFDFFQKSRNHFCRKHLSELLLNWPWIFKSWFEHDNFVRLSCFSELRLINLRKLNQLVIFGFLLFGNFFSRSSNWCNVSFLFVLVISFNLIKVVFEDFDVVVWATTNKEWHSRLHILILEFNHTVYSVSTFWKMGILNFCLFLISFKLIKFDKSWCGSNEKIETIVYQAKWHDRIWTSLQSFK